MSNTSIWSIDGTLSGVADPGHSRPGRNGSEKVLSIIQISSSIGVSPSDYFMSYPEHALEDFYPSAEMQSIHSTAAAD